MGEQSGERCGLPPGIYGFPAEKNREKGQRGEILPDPCGDRISDEPTVEKRSGFLAET